MEDDKLKWKTIDVERLLDTPVFGVLRQRETAEGGLEGDYIALEAPDCVVIVPEHEGRFTLVRQWRHGAERVTTEFPGGVIENSNVDAELREELAEETGFVAGRLTQIGVANPNPALFKSRFYVFLAGDLTPTGRTHPDADELMQCVTRPIDEVLDSLGTGEYLHAFMGTALAFYLKNEKLKKDRSGLK